ncbi:MAG: DUF86 domain-containing protein [Cyanobacteria bacterium]|nr:DUF86 domain-containing protein [Cyanobacteriota bacterium]MDA0867507.1 DUF86 domain-containing protein [Cyanobacteriota bacterium]
MAIDNLTRLKHMQDAAREAISFVSHKRKEDLTNDRMLQLAVVKELEIIGEAAGKLTQALRDRYPHIPWIDIISMRNRLAHEYFGIDLDIVWDTVQHSLPSLLRELEAMVKQEESGG